jgi:hypothetical protein
MNSQDMEQVGVEATIIAVTEMHIITYVESELQIIDPSDAWRATSRFLSRLIPVRTCIAGLIEPAWTRRPRRGLRREGSRTTVDSLFRVATALGKTIGLRLEGTKPKGRRATKTPA